MLSVLRHQLITFPGQGRGSGAGRPGRSQSLVLVSGGLRVKQKQGVFEQLPPPRRSSRPVRLLSKLCLYSWVNVEPSEQCSLRWAQGLVPWLLRENRIYLCCMGELGQGHAVSVGCVRVCVCACTHKLREQRPCPLALFFCLVISACCGAHGVRFCLLSHSRAWSGQGRCGFEGSPPRSEAVSFWLPTLASIFISSCKATYFQPQGCGFPCPMHPCLGTT